MIKTFLLIGILCLHCQTDTDCKSGSIASGSEAKTTLNKTCTNQSELPADFNYKVVDLMEAVLGSWIDKNGDTVFTILFGRDSKITFNIAGHGQKCGPTCASIFFDCSSKKYQALAIDGSLTFNESIDDGDVLLTIADSSYALKLLKNASTSRTIMIPLANISELALVKTDTLFLCP